MRILRADIAVVLGMLSWTATAAMQYKPTDVPVEYSATVQAVG